jgi:lipopolysaccharide transport system permease protein
MGYLRDVVAARELLTNLTLREVRGKYRRTVFGQLWSLVNPLVLMAIYTFVFAFIFRISPGPGDPSGLEVFPLWLLSGLLPWLFFANVVSTGMASVVSNAGLISKVWFPRVVLPLSAVGSSTWNWLFEMAILAIALMIAGAFVLPWLPLVIVFMLVLAVFAAGMAMLLAIANVFFRDTQHFLSLALQLWMYLSPIIYPISLVREQSERIGPLLGTPLTLEGLYAINPMVHFTEVFRSLLYDNTWPDPLSAGLCVLWAIAAFAIGLLVFRRNEADLAEAL